MLSAHGLDLGSSYVYILPIFMIFFFVASKESKLVWRDAYWVQTKGKHYMSNRFIKWDGGQAGKLRGRKGLNGNQEHQFRYENSLLLFNLMEYFLFLYTSRLLLFVEMSRWKTVLLFREFKMNMFFFLQEESVSVLNLRGEDDVSCSPTTQVCGEVLSSEMQWGNSRQVSNHKAFF